MNKKLTALRNLIDKRRGIQQPVSKPVQDTVAPQETSVPQVEEKGQAPVETVEAPVVEKAVDEVPVVEEPVEIPQEEAPVAVEESTVPQEVVDVSESASKPKRRNRKNREVSNG